MGTKSATETVVRIFQAFLKERTWKQADLARHVGVGTQQLRKKLDELIVGGVPLEDESEPPHVIWSVPNNWFPGGVVFSRIELIDLLRLLNRLSNSAARNRLVERIVQSARTATRPSLSPVITPQLDAQDEETLATVEDAASQRGVLRVRYFSAKRGTSDVREMSVQRVMPGPPGRALAICHRDNALKWFRIDAMDRAGLIEGEFRIGDKTKIEETLRTNTNGFSGQEGVCEVVFRVADPDARWVSRNLSDNMRSTSIEGGIRVIATTTSVDKIARYVVGLGVNAVAETESLRLAICEVAGAALKANSARI